MKSPNNSAGARHSTPSSNGVRLAAHENHKGYQELAKVGLIADTQPTIHGAQATGCSPISVAQKAGLDFFRPVKPDTIAKSLAIGTPADGFYALKVMRDTGGAART